MKRKKIKKLYKLHKKNDKLLEKIEVFKKKMIEIENLLWETYTEEER